MSATKSNGNGKTKGRKKRPGTVREMVGLTLPEHLMAKVEKAIDARGYNNKSEFVRRAVVSKLDELGYVEDAGS